MGGGGPAAGLSELSTGNMNVEAGCVGSGI